MKNIHQKGASPVIIIIVILILIAVGFYFFTAPKVSDVKDEIKTNSSQPVGFEENPTNLPADEGVVSAEISIEDFVFDPIAITIKKGESVTWTNNDSAPHTVTSSSNLFDSGNLAKGEVYSREFSEPGTYAYICAYHPNMKATVIVTE